MLIVVVLAILFFAIILIVTSNFNSGKNHNSPTPEPATPTTPALTPQPTTLIPTVDPREENIYF